MGKTIRSIATLVCNVDTIDNLFAAEGSWAGNEVALDQAVAGSKIGAKMWAYALEANMDTRIAATMNRIITINLSSSKITKAKQKSCINLITIAMQALSDAVQTKERSPIISFQGQSKGIVFKIY